MNRRQIHQHQYCILPVPVDPAFLKPVFLLTWTLRQASRLQIRMITWSLFPRPPE